MEDFVAFVLLVLAVIVGVPALITGNLYARIRRLRGELEDLQQRLARLERAEPATRIPAAQLPATQLPAIQPSGSQLPGSQLPVTPLPAAVGSHSSGIANGFRVRTEDAQPSTPPQLPRLPPLPPLPPPEPTLHDEDPESLESRIGGRWLLNIGIAAIVIAVAYFEKYAIDRQWINETARVVQGGIFGAVLIAVGGRFVKKGYALYGQMLTGGGVAILYVSIYAAFIFYHLIARGPAFAMMVAVTALGAWLADRHQSQGLAVLAVGGGFMTPFLLHGSADAQIALFTYVAIMVGGTVFLAQRHEWPLLNVVSYIFTLITAAAWADRFYTPDKYLRTELFFTVYCAMFIAIAARSGRMRHPFAQFVSWFLWTATAAYYVASLALLTDHPMAMLVWLIGVALVSGVLSVVAARGAELVVWFAAALPLLGWANLHAGAEWLTPGLVTVAAVYGIALAAQLRQAGSGRSPDAVHIAWMHLAALLMFAGAYFLVEPVHLAATGPMAGSFAVWQGCLALFFWDRDRDRAVHFAALGFTLLSIGIALQFDGPAVIIGWAAEGAAVIALGLYVRRDWLRLGGGILLGIALVQTLDLLLSIAPANHVVILNPRAACALLVVTLCYAIAWLHHRDGDAGERPLVIGASLVTAQVVSLVLLTTEIHAYFALRDAAFTREMLVSVTWAVYATVLIVVGLQRRYAPIRYFAIGLFGLTIAKVFFSDLAELQRIYRIMSVFALGITLLLTSYLYQRMRGTALGNDHAQ